MIGNLSSKSNFGCIRGQNKTFFVWISGFALFAEISSAAVTSKSTWSNTIKPVDTRWPSGMPYPFIKRVTSSTLTIHANFDSPFNVNSITSCQEISIAGHFNIIHFNIKHTICLKNA